MFNNAFYIAASIYLFNSFANVGQGIVMKYYTGISDVNLYQYLFIRSIISILILLPFNFKNIFTYAKHYKMVIFLATLCAFDVLLWNMGLQYIPVNNGTLIMLLIPMWIVILGYVILKERNITRVNIIAIVLCVIASCITVVGGIEKGGALIGYLLIFINSINVAFGLVLQKKFYSSRPVIYALFTNAVALAVISLVLADFKIPEITNDVLKVSSILSGLDIMEFATVYIAYKMTDVVLLQPIRFTRIIFSVVLSYFVLHEMTNLSQIIAIVIVICANVLLIVGKNKKVRSI